MAYAAPRNPSPSVWMKKMLAKTCTPATTIEIAICGAAMRCAMSTLFRGLQHESCYLSAIYMHAEDQQHISLSALPTLSCHTTAVARLSYA